MPVITLAEREASAEVNQLCRKFRMTFSTFCTKKAAKPSAVWSVALVTPQCHPSSIDSEHRALLMTAHNIPVAPASTLFLLTVQQNLTTSCVHNNQLLPVNQIFCEIAEVCGSILLKICRIICNYNYNGCVLFQIKIDLDQSRFVR